MTRAGSEPGGVGAPKGSEEKTRKGDRYGDRKIDVRSAIEDLNTKIPPRSKDGRSEIGWQKMADGWGRYGARSGLEETHIAGKKQHFIYLSTC